MAVPPYGGRLVREKSARIFDAVTDAETSAVTNLVAASVAGYDPDFTCTIRPCPPVHGREESGRVASAAVGCLVTQVVRLTPQRRAERGVAEDGGMRVRIHSRKLGLVRQARTTVTSVDLGFHYMGISYRIDDILDCVVVVWDGRVTAEEQMEHVLRLAADRRWPPGGFMLTDLTTATDVTLPDGDLVEVLTEGMNAREQLKAVILVRPAFLEETWIDDAVELRGAIPTPFTDLDSACAHLGVSTPAVQRTIDDVRQELGRQGT
jgi:hypothetical protein